MASSPLPEVDEDVGDATDLWESASLDYPGRNMDGTVRNSPTGWEFMNEDEMSFEEPHYYTWHLWFLGFSWLLGLCLGIPAALMARYNPGSPRNPVRPGCYIPVDPFEDVYSYSINDPGFLFNICYIVVVYLVMALFMIALIISICVRRTRNNKHRRYVKILICLAVIFFVSRAPMDMKQLTGLIEAARNFKNLHRSTYELEYEIMLVWATYLPIVIHPIVFLCFVSEFRQGALKAIRGVFGCKNPPEEEKNEHYKEQEILDNRSTVSKTQVSNML